MEEEVEEEKKKRVEEEEAASAAATATVTATAEVSSAADTHTHESSHYHHNHSSENSSDFITAEDLFNSAELRDEVSAGKGGNGDSGGGAVDDATLINHDSTTSQTVDYSISQFTIPHGFVPPPPLLSSSPSHPYPPQQSAAADESLSSNTTTPMTTATATAAATRTQEQDQHHQPRNGDQVERSTYKKVLLSLKELGYTGDQAVALRQTRSFGFTFDPIYDISAASSQSPPRSPALSPLMSASSRTLSPSPPPTPHIALNDVLLRLIPSRQWVAVMDVYACLGAEARKLLRTSPAKTLANYLTELNQRYAFQQEQCELLSPSFHPSFPPSTSSFNTFSNADGRNLFEFNLPDVTWVRITIDDVTALLPPLPGGPPLSPGGASEDSSGSQSSSSSPRAAAAGVTWKVPVVPLDEVVSYEAAERGKRVKQKIKKRIRAEQARAGSGESAAAVAQATTLSMVESLPTDQELHDRAMSDVKKEIAEKGYIDHVASSSSSSSRSSRGMNDDHDDEHDLANAPRLVFNKHNNSSSNITNTNNNSTHDNDNSKRLTGSYVERYEAVGKKFDPSRDTQWMGAESPSAIKHKLERLRASSITPQMLASSVPTYFVPMSEALKHMPEGYTEEHLRNMFERTQCLEVIECAGIRYIRLQAGRQYKAHVDFTSIGGCPADALYPAYKPKPALCAFFASPAMMPRRGQLVDLYELIMKRTPEEIQQQLPFQGPASLLYFVQMQHIFGFTPPSSSGGGGPPGGPGGAPGAATNNNFAAGGVGLPPSPPTGLRFEQTPTPMLTYWVWNMIRLAPLSILAILNRLPNFVRNDLREYYSVEIDVTTAALAAGNGGTGGGAGARGWGGGGLVGGPPSPAKRNSAAFVIGAGIATTTNDSDSSRNGSASGIMSSHDNEQQHHNAGADTGTDIAADDIVTSRLRMQQETLKDIEFLHRFVQIHGGLFGFKGSRPWDIQSNQVQKNDPDAIVDLRCNIEAEARLELPLEERIRHAENIGDRRKVKKLKRRLALQQTPDNPYADPELLITKVIEYLPFDRSISLAALRLSLPEEVVQMLPVQMKKWILSNSPTRWKVWEVGRPNKFFLSRTHLPPPRGALKTDPNLFSDLDCLRVVALGLRRGPKTIEALNSRIPVAVDIALRTRLGGLDNIASRYPQFFSLTIADHDTNDLRHALLSLIRMPTAENKDGNDENNTAAGGDGDGTNDGDTTDSPVTATSGMVGGDGGNGSNDAADAAADERDLYNLFTMNPEEATGSVVMDDSSSSGTGWMDGLAASASSLPNTTRGGGGGEGAAAAGDESIKCRQCSATFVFTAREAKQFEKRGHTNKPSRCPACRKQARGWGGSGGNGGGGATSTAGDTTAEHTTSGTTTSNTTDDERDAVNGTDEQSNNNKVDRDLQCRDCKVTFVFSVRDQNYFESKGFQHTPSRCPECRKVQRKQPF